MSKSVMERANESVKYQQPETLHDSTLLYNSISLEE